MINKLETVSAYHQEQAEFHSVESEKHDQLSIVADNEAQRAKSVAKKLKELVG